jgi:hypothetical protein
MIISASRRTDIPAFYSRWLIQRIRDGFCEVINPFNSNQRRTVSLKSKDVDLIVFWTRNARPLLPYLKELDERGLHYYFLYTLVNYDTDLEPHSVAPEQLIDDFHQTADQISPDRVVWRYDPIIISQKYNWQYHLETFETLAARLQSATRRVIVSLIDYYRKTLRNLANIHPAREQLNLSAEQDPGLVDFLGQLAAIAGKYQLEIQSCCEAAYWANHGIKAGKCIDDEYIRRVFQITVDSEKDPGQRAACQCVRSVDIGAYDTCPGGCRYCYANHSPAAARKNFRDHKPECTALAG